MGAEGLSSSMACLCRRGHKRPQRGLVLIRPILAAAHPALYGLDAGDRTRRYLGRELILEGTARTGPASPGGGDSCWDGGRYGGRDGAGPGGPPAAGARPPPNGTQPTLATPQTHHPPP